MTYDEVLQEPSDRQKILDFVIHLEYCMRRVFDESDIDKKYIDGYIDALIEVERYVERI